MNLSNQESLDDFADRHRELGDMLRAIRETAEAAEWETPLDVKMTFSGARTARGGYVILNIKGGDFRLVARVDYVMGTMDIRFIGTHADYDRFRKRGGMKP